MRTGSTVRLQDVADGRANNFDVLRLFAALLVLVSHAFPLTGRTEPLAAVGGPTMGGLGVGIFFAMSGFLIVKSWTFEPRAAAFLRKRAVRILPALWVAVAVTVLVVGTLATTLPVGAYLTSPGTWTYLARCMVLVTFDGSLPGVFADAPYPDAVNGSLWTLPIEVCAYVMVLTLGVLGALRRRTVVLATAVLVAGAATALQGGSIVADGLTLVAYFLAGMTTYLYRDRITLAWLPAVILLGAWILAFDTPLRVPLGFVALTYAVFVIAYRSPRGLARLCAAGDVSYGVYIYAFPLQQVAVTALGADTPALNVLVAAPVTWLVALASWRIVERPALRLKSARRVHPPLTSSAVRTPVLQEP